MNEDDHDGPSARMQAERHEGEWVDAVRVRRSPLDRGVWVPLPAGVEGPDVSLCVHAGSLSQVRTWAAQQFGRDAAAMRWRSPAGADGAHDEHLLQVRLGGSPEAGGAVDGGPASTEVQAAPYLPAPREVLAARSAAGGWSRDDLARWGVPWPPPKGWRAELERRWLETDRSDGADVTGPTA